MAKQPSLEHSELWIFAPSTWTNPDGPHFDECGHQRWDVARLQESMGKLLSEPLFVSGCSEDQVALYPQFSKIILLSAPKSVIAQRLACRTNNAYGKGVAELEEVMRNLDEIEPSLRKRATHEIVTTQPIDAVVDAILDISCPSTHCSRRAKTHTAEQ